MDAKLKFGLIFILLGFTSRGIQGISEYYIEDAYIDEINSEYLDEENTNVEVVWINSTLSGIAVNLTVIKDMPPATTGHLNMFQKTFGEYKTHSGISVNLPWCKMITDRVMMGSLVRALNMTKCPPPLGTYSVAEWHPSTSRMPDYFPGTQYKIDFAIKDRKKVLLQLAVLSSIY